MKTSKDSSRETKERFWHAVRACLREFHHASPTDLSKVSKLRQKIEVAPMEEVELFFHVEPFNVACGLAGRRLPIEPHLKRYLEIRDGQDNHEQKNQAV